MTNTQAAGHSDFKQNGFYLRTGIHPHSHALMALGTIGACRECFRFNGQTDKFHVIRKKGVEVSMEFHYREKKPNKRQTGIAIMVKILLADDHKIIRDGLRSLINNQSGMEVVAEADNGRNAVKLTRKLKPDLIIMDISMPDLNGIEATRQIIAESHGIKIIALSMHVDKRFVVEMFNAGVSGYLLKDCAFEELSGAIRAVTSNQTYLSPKLTGEVIKDYVHQYTTKNAPTASNLSPREREVLQLIAEGRNTKEIASRLNVSVKTVETHRRKIMERLDVRSIAELTKYAIREGLTSLEI